MSDRWVCFAIAWSPERVARMHTSLALVRDWLAVDGAHGLGMTGPERWEVRQRAVASGLKTRDASLVRDVLLADARRLVGPGGRVQERARSVTAAVQEALRASGGTRMPVGGSPGLLARPRAVLERSVVERYAVVEHGWTAQDPVLVVEDLPWGSVEVDRRRMQALPVGWTGILADPIALGLDGDSWQAGVWKFGEPRPVWADDPACRARVFAYVRVFGWNGTPLRADLDEVERYLPMRRPRTGQYEHMAWLVPGVDGWCLAWSV